MNLRRVLDEIREPEAEAAVGVHWDEAAADYPGALPFLTEAAIRDQWQWSGFDEPLPEIVARTARRVLESPALSRYAWYVYWRLYLGPDHPPTAAFPSLEAALGEDSGVFHLLLAMAMVPLVRERHRKLGMPEEVTRDTCRQNSCHCLNYRRGRGGLHGLYRRQLQWHRHYVVDRLFRIGRFEYMAGPFRGHVEVYRNRETGQVTALLAAGKNVYASGHVCGRPGETPAFTTVLELTGESVTGHPVSAGGFVSARTVRLPLDAWDRVLKKGDPVLQMHIPAGGDMTPESCRASLLAAPDFFRRFFPDHQARAVSSDSWIFNPQLQEILPPDANLVLLQRELHLFPLGADIANALWLVFLQDRFDPATAPRETRLQRAILDFLAAGNRWFGAGMFILIDDVKHFGSQYYRAMEAGNRVPAPGD